MSSRQNPLHLSSCYQLSPFWGGPISLLGAHIAFGGPIPLQCFVDISDKSASAILQWF